MLTRGVLPEKRKYIGHYLTSVREGLIHDLATAEEDLSMAQRVLIDRVITFLGVVRLIEEHARERGILDSRGQLTSGLTVHYLSFNRHIKDCLALLGIEKRKVDEPLDLGRYLAEKDAEKAKAEAAGQGDGVSKAGEGEKSPLERPGRKGQGKDKASRARVKGGGQASGEGVGTEPAREGNLEGGGDE